MSGTYRDQLDSFFTNLREEALTELRDTDSIYDALRRKQSDLARQEQTILSGLPEDQRDVLHNMRELRHSIGAVEFDFLYRQGYLDCIQLLRYLKLL